MNILIIGGGRDGEHLAEMLLAEPGKHKLTIIEKSHPTQQKLARTISNAAILHGDGCDPKVLEEAGIAMAEVVVAVTTDDEDNLVICQLAKFEFKVPKVIARINYPKNEWLFTPEMGVDLAVSKAHIVGKIIEEEATLGDLVTLLKLRKGQLALVEEKIKPAAKAIGKRIVDLTLPADCVIVAIVREDKIQIPKPELALQAGDAVLALTSLACEKMLMELLA